ncbi:MAG TPA: hypothetical protein VFR04_06865 [Solirubrobacterales bacterium]|nr:hypothetical protein [Solirubrobacterales bacterium]
MALAVLVCALLAPGAAGAEVFTVDSAADETDLAPGLDGCLTAGAKCTLRAAIEESNSSVGESDEIVFEEPPFDGGATSTITIGSSLPTMVDPVRINGRECPTAAGVAGPCVGVDGPGTGPALAIEDADGVEVEGLAVTGAQVGISIKGSEFARVRGSWFGVKLSGVAGGNTTGAFVAPGSDFSRIGGEGQGAGNVFANSTDEGLDLSGVSNVRVLGNYFGVSPNGTTLAANGEDVEVTSFETLEAVGNSIGTRVSAKAVSTPACDGGCNLISGATSSGVDLEGEGGQEAPALATTIAGNYIGLNATGTASVPNVATGIRAGGAAQTVIGGPKASDANRINGGGAGILAGPAAPDLVVRGNLVGVDAAGTGTLAPPDEGIAVDSGELPSTAVEAAIVDNEIRMDGGAAISQQGFGATIADNEIFGGEIGIATSGLTGGHGNRIEDNLLEGPGINGVRVENDLNEVLGNEISEAGGAGIRVQNSTVFGSTENLIGGDAAADENVIVGSGGDAIEIVDTEGTVNEVARNRGAANAGLFIDLLAASPATEPDGPNNGIEPPGFSTSTQTGATGVAEAGARVRVFRKQNAEAGELESFLGETTADAEGNWKVVYGAAVAVAGIVAATQTGEAGGTSELAVATVAGESGGAGPLGGASVATDAAPPQTKIVKAPKRKSKSRIARFRFESDESSSTFQCRLDGRPFRACTSPKRYQGLGLGKHVFEVRAIDPAGNADATPAKRKFTVLG